MSRKKVLVIEDNPLNMKLVKELITISHHHAVAAANAEEGIALARSERPDLILLDIQLPGMDGFSALKIIKGDPIIAHIPVVALTAHAMQGDEQRAMAAGCDGYLSKPIDAARFFKHMETWLKGPYAAAETRQTPSVEDRAPQWAHSILVVDDDPLNVKLLEAALGAAGYRIFKAYSGPEALDAIERSTPDLILLDIMMPGMDGYEVIRRLKQREETKDIPIVLITALEGAEEKTRGLSAGADEFLNKPVDTTELEARVLSLLRMKKYHEQLNTRIQAQTHVIGETDPETPAPAVAGGPLVLLVADDQKDARLICRYLHEMATGCRLVRTGAEALRTILSERVDLALLDLTLPDLDGIEICRRIKVNEDTRAVQVVIVATSNDMRMKIRGIESGADDFLVKPLNRGEIKARVTALLKKKAFMDRLRERADAALQAAIFDRLTGTHNYAYFKHFMALEIKRSKRHENKMALLMIDVDDFKQVNDTHGHPAGDRVLAALGKLLRTHVRDVDLVARYGGEEFTVVLPYAGWHSGGQVAERLLELISRQPVPLDAGEIEPVRMTVSIGLAVFPDCGNSADGIIKAADDALYDAKRQGKNRVCFAASHLEPLSLVNEK